jgi:outer membrane murein-binding lipoprotein Lpp
MDQQTRDFLTGIMDIFNKKINQLEEKIDWLCADVKAMSSDVSSIQSAIEDIESRLNQAGQGAGAGFEDLKPWEPEPEPVKPGPRKTEKSKKGGNNDERI